MGCSELGFFSSIKTDGSKTLADFLTEQNHVAHETIGRPTSGNKILVKA